jgi:uncharacterized membrane protein YhdT
VTRDDQLQWEARWALPAAIASFLAGVLFVISASRFLPKDRKGTGRVADLLVSIDEQSGSYLSSVILSAVAGLLLVGAFYYLFRAVEARGGGVPHWFQYLIFAAPLMFAIGSVVGALHAIDAADDFVSAGVIRGDEADKHARDLLSPGPVVVAAQTAGTVGVAFLFVMLPLRARRVGLLTPFMGILGAIAGALIVFQLAGISAIVQGFWLGALGVVFLGRWPGGRGPAWETGEAEPWLSARRRQAQLIGDPPPADPPPADPSPDAAPGTADPEPVPDRPSSRKRRKKRR